MTAPSKPRKASRASASEALSKASDRGESGASYGSVPQEPGNSRASASAPDNPEFRNNEEQFRALADAMPQLAWMANAEGWIFWFNQRWYEYTGKTPEQMQGWGWQSVHDPAVLPLVMERWRGSLASGEPFEMIFPLLGSDGQYREFLTRIVPIRDADGHISRWFGTNTDVSGQFAIEEALRQKQTLLESTLIASQRLAAIVESSDDAIVSKDLSGIVTSWNSAAERIFGYTAKEMIGRSITTIIPPELHPDEDTILATISRGERIEHFETVRLTKSGERLDIALTISPVRDDSGRIIGAAKIARDITHHKRTERALQLAEKLASVGRLAATVAHEINNPLEAVTNFIFLAQRTPGLPKEAEKYLAMADAQLERISHIAQQTLGFYRDTAGPAMTDIRQSLDDVLRVFENKLRYKALSIDTDGVEDLKIETLGGELRQVFSNLISNAIDASPRGGTIVIRARTIHMNGRSRARITVADHGYGVRREIKQSIFKPFITTKKDVGTGLGLWATKNMVEKQGGRIAFRSAEGKGTVFTVELPTVPVVPRDKTGAAA